MRALVTGAAGFVGGHLVPRLERAGYTVAGSAELDVTDAEAVDAAVIEAHPSLVVHLAALSSVPEAAREPERSYRVNYLGSRVVLAAVERRAPAARVLLASSAEIYGPAGDGEAFSERAPLRPASPYARAKAAADLLGARYAARGLAVVRVRPFPHTGPGQSEAFALASFAKQAAEIAAGRREPVVQVGSLASVRDYLDVEDVVEAYLALADPAVPPGAYNVAGGRAVKVGEALGAILRLAGVDAAIEVEAARMRPPDRAVGDASLLRERTGWHPRIPLERTLERLVADWRERISAA